MNRQQKHVNRAQKLATSLCAEQRDFLGQFRVECETHMRWLSEMKLEVAAIMKALRGAARILKAASAHHTKATKSKRGRTKTGTANSGRLTK
jgi:hypothetical protein